MPSQQLSERFAAIHIYAEWIKMNDEGCASGRENVAFLTARYKKHLNDRESRTQLQDNIRRTKAEIARLDEESRQHKETIATLTRELNAYKRDASRGVWYENTTGNVIDGTHATAPDEAFNPDEI